LRKYRTLSSSVSANTSGALDFEKVKAEPYCLFYLCEPLLILCLEERLNSTGNVRFALCQIFNCLSVSLEQRILMLPYNSELVLDLRLYHGADKRLHGYS
jgi:hypothetical protein